MTGEDWGRGDMEQGEPWGYGLTGAVVATEQSYRPSRVYLSASPRVKTNPVFYRLYRSLRRHQPFRSMGFLQSLAIWHIHWYLGYCNLASKLRNVILHSDLLISAPRTLIIRLDGAYTK